LLGGSPETNSVFMFVAVPQAAIPEPSSAVFCLICISGLTIFQRRKRLVSKALS
jgi:hypothetical protein